MKAEIHISGQFAGNIMLKNFIECYDVRETMFHGYVLKFQTKKEARKALWEAFKSLRNNFDPSERGRLSYSAGHSIHWDASRAELM